MERLTQNNFDYCLEMCEPECMRECAFYKGDGDTKCHAAAVYEKLREYEETGLPPDGIKGLVISFRGALTSEIVEETGSANISRIREIAKAEQDGRLVVLPCKVGDTVYVVGYCGEIYTHRDWETGAQECPFEGDCELEECDDNTLRVFETTCDGFVLDKLDKKLHITLKSIGLDSGDVLGERVFLTRAEAEKAMEVRG